MEQINEGAIVIAPFRFGETEQKKLRPCLVWHVTPVCVVLVYISSKHVSETGSRPTEVALGLKEATAVGLSKPSRIDFSKRDKIMPWQIVKIVGHIDALPRRKLAECAEAADAAGLLNG